jgi:hypothetical protein
MILPNGTHSFSLTGDNDCGAIDMTPHVVTLSGGVSIPQGTAYKIVVTSGIGINYWTGSVNFPTDYSPYFSIIGSDVSSTILAIHDWEVSGSSCARLPVIATIDTNCGNTCPNHLDVNTAIISSGIYKAAQTLYSSGNIPTGSAVIFKAGQSIELGVNFAADIGSEFEAIIEGCN